MKQIVQDIKSGETNLIQTSVPSIDSKSMLIQTSRSLVSLGTEKMLVDQVGSDLLIKLST